MNWINRVKKIGIKVKQILKKQPAGNEETNWKNCPQCKKISYLPDLISNSYICECTFHFDLPVKIRLKNLELEHAVFLFLPMLLLEDWTSNK